MVLVVVVGEVPDVVDPRLSQSLFQAVIPVVFDCVVTGFVVTVVVD